MAAFVPKFTVFLLILIAGYRLVSRVHGEKSGGRPVVPCVRPGPFGEKMTFDNPNGLGGPRS